jgi:hypothetical protein
LATNQKPKVDPKVQSPQNVNDLKSALAAIMNKSASPVQAKPVAPMNNEFQATKSSPDGFKPLSSLKDVVSQQVKPAQQTAQPAPQPVSKPMPKPAQQSLQNAKPEQKTLQSKEVPEEVLNKVLKGD